MITSCIIWIPVTTLVFFLLRVWVRYRACSLLPQLRQPDSDGRIPRVVGFFHPYCNAGGGGERVLWTAIRALQKRYPRLKCVVYTGDAKVTGEEILAKAQERFNIVLPRTGSEDLAFVFLERRKWVEDKPYPLFTLLGQSVGSVVLGWEALMLCVPDVFVDTMGYAFTLPLFKYLGGCRVACYVHYPTISTDMLARVSSRTSAHNNASFISRSPLLSYVKLFYYRIFAYVYGMAGKRSDLIMVNSTWTQGHIISLWKAPLKTFVLYPPCDTNNFVSIPLKDDSLRKTHYIVSIAQFRPEKDHPLQISSFHKFLSGLPASQSQNYKLVLIGSVRNSEDASRVENLRTLCKEMDLTDRVEFKLNVSFEELKNDLAGATIGLHTMWNEHFGIGVVECMAAGSIILAHDSGGPKLDIVVNYENQKTGFLADDINSYAAAMTNIFAMTSEERLAIRTSARESVTRFSEKNFEDGFIDCCQSLFQEF